MVSLKELMLKCKRCGHRWLRRSASLPAQCPKCKNKFWNQDRVRKIAPERKAARRA